MLLTINLCTYDCYYTGLVFEYNGKPQRGHGIFNKKLYVPSPTTTISFVFLTVMSVIPLDI